MNDHDKVKKYINIAKGQLEGIVKMIDEDRYCLEISDQLMATRSLLKKTNNLILKNHIDYCVKNAIENGENDKIEEVIKALEKLLLKQEINLIMIDVQEDLILKNVILVRKMVKLLKKQILQKKNLLKKLQQLKRLQRRELLERKKMKLLKL